MYSFVPNCKIVLPPPIYETLVIFLPGTFYLPHSPLPPPLTIKHLSLDIIYICNKLTTQRAL